MKKDNTNFYKFLVHLTLPVGMLLMLAFNNGHKIEKQKGSRFENFPDSSIVGNWVNSTDTSWKLVFFSNNTCQQYYSNTLIETDNWVIANTSPQCGVTVPIDSLTSYLQLTNQANSRITICYEINGITSTILSIRPINLYNIFLFNKQN